MIDRGGFIISKQKLDTVAVEESLVYINKSWCPPLLKLPGPYTQRICVDLTKTKASKNKLILQTSITLKTNWR